MRHEVGRHEKRHRPDHKIGQHHGLRAFATERMPHRCRISRHHIALPRLGVELRSNRIGARPVARPDRLIERGQRGGLGISACHRPDQRGPNQKSGGKDFGKFHEGPAFRPWGVRITKAWRRHKKHRPEASTACRSDNRRSHRCRRWCCPAPARPFHRRSGRRTAHRSCCWNSAGHCSGPGRPRCAYRACW